MNRKYVKNKGLHIGLIMDGNGRWATQQGQPRLYGHAFGVQTVIDVVRECPTLDVYTVTLFAFAIANWKRDKQEVDGLWSLFYEFITNSSKELLDEGVCITFIGDRTGLPKKIQSAIEKLESDSRENNSLLLQVALNYDGIDEVARMIKKIIVDKVSAEEIDTQYVLNHLDTQKGNDPDIIIRTGMEKPREGMSLWRSSAFLPLQSVQSVCVSTAVLWPDFSVAHLKEIIEYAKPDKRLFGGQRRE